MALPWVADATLSSLHTVDAICFRDLEDEVVVWVSCAFRPAASSCSSSLHTVLLIDIAISVLSDI